VVPFDRDTLPGTRRINRKIAHWTTSGRVWSHAGEPSRLWAAALRRAARRVALRAPIAITLDALQGVAPGPCRTTAVEPRGIGSRVGHPTFPPRARLYQDKRDRRETDPRRAGTGSWLKIRHYFSEPIAHAPMSHAVGRRS